MLKNRVLLSAALAVIALARAAEAGQITDLTLYDGTSNSPIVTVNYSNADGSGNNYAETYADPQVSGGTTAPIYYCIDLWHDNYLGSTYTFDATATLSYVTSTFADVDNRLAWLVNQPQNTVDERAAVQLAMWYTIDNIVTGSFAGFSYTGGDSTLRTDYNQLISFAGYNPDVSYTADFWAANHDPGNTLYQDLISSVPEPNTLVLAGIGMAAGMGTCIRRGRRRLASAA